MNLNLFYNTAEMIVLIYTYDLKIKPNRIFYFRCLVFTILSFAILTGTQLYWVYTDLIIF